MAALYKSVHFFLGKSGLPLDGRLFASGKLITQFIEHPSQVKVSVNVKQLLVSQLLKQQGSGNTRVGPRTDTVGVKPAKSLQLLQ
jgi:hypothetical protein